MIKLKELELINFGPIEHFNMSLDGKSGTYSIEAPNGSGKSHVVAALRALLMPGAGFQRPLGSYCRVLNGEIFKASLRAVVDVDGDELEVTRTITPGRDQDIVGILAAAEVPKATGKATATFRGIKYSGSKGAQSVDELLASVVGINNEVQASAVFVMQEQAGSMWTMDQAPRIRAFQALSGAEVMEELNKVASQKLDFFKATDYTSQLEVAEKDVSRLQEEISGLENKLSAMPIPDSAVINENQQKLAAHRHALEIEQQRASVEVQLQQDVANLANAEAQLQGLVYERDKWKFTEENNRKYNDTLRLLTSQIATADGIRAAEQRRTDRLKAATEQIAKLKEAQLAAVFMFNDEIPEELGKQLEKAKQDIATILVTGKSVRSFLDTFAATKSCPTCGSTGVCPQCHHVTMDIAHLVATKQAERDQLAAKHKELSALIADLTPRHANAVEFQRQFMHREETLRLREAELAEEMAMSGQTTMSDEEYNTLVAQRDQYSKAIAEYDRWHQLWVKAEANVNRLRSVVEIARAKVSGGVDSGHRLSPEEVAAAESAIAYTQDLMANRSGMEGQLKAYKDQHAEAVKRAADLATKKAENEKTAEAAAMLQEIKTATHPASIPRETAAAYLEKVNLNLGIYCRELRLPFTLYVEPENMNLMLQSDKVHAMAKYHWSGGLRTMISWAWHLTLYALHGSSIGLMVIDELSNGLDADNMDCVITVMEQMSEYCKGTSLQLLFVSHESSICGVADHVIKLKETNVDKPKPKSNRRSKKSSA